MIEYFPGNFTPSSAQTKILSKVQEFVKSKQKYLVVNAPTGTGKSHIAKTVCNSIMDIDPPDEYVKRVSDYSIFQFKDGGYMYADILDNTPAFGSCILTTTKQLQMQYTQLFEDITDLQGKANYQCGIDEDVNVEWAACNYIPDLKPKCWKNNVCPYYNRRKEALLNKTSTFNYSMYLSLPEFLRKRKVLICDEASELEESLVGQYTVVIPVHILKKLGVTIPRYNIESSDSMGELINSLFSQLTLIVNEEKESSAKKKEHKVNKRLAICQTILHKIKTYVEYSWDKTEYVYKQESKDGNTFVYYIPLHVDKLACNFFESGEKVILMSATIIDHKTFCKGLGITDYDYIEVESGFDAKNAPILVSNALYLNKANLESNLPYIAKFVKGILDTHPNQKGIIHTHTMSIALYIKSMVNDDRLLVRTTDTNNKEIIEEHFKSDKPTVLVSPSLAFGLDLKEDLARFQVIVKAPYPNLGDIRISKLFKSDPDWYQNNMLKTVIQACGRGVRNANDTCITYILDGNIGRAIQRNSSLLPKYFLDRIA